MNILITIREERIKGLEAIKTAERFREVILWLNKRYDRNFRADHMGHYNSKGFLKNNVTVLLKD